MATPLPPEMHRRLPRAMALLFGAAVLWLVIGIAGHEILGIVFGVILVILGLLTFRIYRVRAPSNDD